ncbi:MAG TPA: SRPBCC family protein [Chitinophagales bacterium]|nr:SRPBCC family protein [Chitinophagales bacterium]
MSKIELITHIHAPIQRCFDLSRSIDLHLHSTSHTGERVIAGRTSGLIGMSETVTWRAKHFGSYRRLTVKIIAFNSPSYFEDVMINGDFKFMQHRHYFIEQGDDTIMKDFFEFESPFGFVGEIAERLFLKNYLMKLLRERNEVIRQVAESNQWQKFL